MCYWYFWLQVVRLGMFEVQSHKLIHSLVRRAQELQQRLVDRMLLDHQEINKKSVQLFYFSSPPSHKKVKMQPR